MKVISLSLATTIWALVQNEHVISQRQRVDVHYTWPTAESLLPVAIPPSRIVLSIDGPQGLVHTLQPAQMWVDIDLSSAQEGINIIDYSTADIIGLPSQLTVSQVSPPELEIAFEAPIDRILPIQPTVLEESVAEGWNVVSVTTVPPSVRVIGPQSVILGLDRVPTDVIDITNLDEDQTYQVDLVNDPPTVHFESISSVAVSVDIEEVMVTRTFQEVPLTIAHEGWVSQTPFINVTIEGPLLSVQNLETDDIVAIAQFNNDPTPNSPFELVRVADPEQPGITVTLEAPDVNIISVRPKRIAITANEPE